MEDRCICCGAVVPEGTMVCPKCIDKENKKAEERKRTQNIGDAKTPKINDKASGVMRFQSFAKNANSL